MMALRTVTILTVVVLFATALESSAQIFRTLTIFDDKNGQGPAAALVQGPDGDFYGTTAAGGANRYGEVYKISAKGTLTTLHSFNKTDGMGPGQLSLAGDGNFYGTTPEGGAHSYGTVFRVTSKGILTTLYNFNYVDGVSPSGGVIQGLDGNLYGTTAGGGEGKQCNGGGRGTVFRLTLSGGLTTLYTFCPQAGCSDGAEPYTGLLQGTDGNFYGTTRAGGGGVGCSFGCGTIFKISRTGALTTLYRFCQQDGCPDSAQPLAGLVQANDGNFYGTTGGSGVNGDFGVVFQMTPEGSVTTIHAFSVNEGQVVYGTLVQGTDQYLYGAAYQGGDLSCSPPLGCGTLFQVSTGGILNVLHLFESPNGTSPHAGLMQATSGVFYGTTYFRGPNSGAGTIFGLSMGLGPFVSLPRDFGKVGAVEGILGQGLTGTTAVSFNGVAATFTVKSGSLILATVPPGATTGVVTVTTSGGTLTSNVPFYVLP